MLHGFYIQKAKKNKKFKATLKLFNQVTKSLENKDEADVDNDAQKWINRKRILLDEFFINVCFGFFGWQLRLFFIYRNKAQNLGQQIQKLTM